MYRYAIRGITALKGNYAEQYEPQAKAVADNTSINVVECIIADCSPMSIVIDFHTSLDARRICYQSDIYHKQCHPVI